MQPRSETLEKAFNKLMSCGNSRCCICSLMESPSPFSKFQRKKLDALVYQLERESTAASSSQTPLTVIVKRSMVQLPTSLLSNSQVANPDCSDTDLIACSECNICVHKCEWFLLLNAIWHIVIITVCLSYSLLWSWQWKWLWGGELDLSEMSSSRYKSRLLSLSTEGWGTQANRWWAVGAPHLCYGHPWSEPGRCAMETASYDRGHHQGHQKTGTLMCYDNMQWCWNDELSLAALHSV